VNRKDRAAPDSKRDKKSALASDPSSALQAASAMVIARQASGPTIWFIPV
jgi:hypothetical protein